MISLEHTKSWPRVAKRRDGDQQAGRPPASFNKVAFQKGLAKSVYAHMEKLTLTRYTTAVGVSTARGDQGQDGPHSPLYNMSRVGREAPLSKHGICTDVLLPDRPRRHLWS